MELPKSTKDKLILDHLKLISSILAEGIIIPAKTVRANASSAAIYLPKVYVGHTFKVILLPETEQDKELFKKSNALVERDAKIRQMEKQKKVLQTKIDKIENEETPSPEVPVETNESGESDDSY